MYKRLHGCALALTSPGQQKSFLLRNSRRFLLMTLHSVQTQLKIAQHELALGEDTGNDLVTQLSWEKDARKKVIELAFHTL